MSSIETLASDFPIIPHDQTGECCGCIGVVVEGNTAVLRCRDCGLTVGTLNAQILAHLVSKMAPT
jgi:hypothetical protein